MPPPPSQPSSQPQTPPPISPQATSPRSTRSEIQPCDQENEKLEPERRYTEGTLIGLPSPGFENSRQDDVDVNIDLEKGGIEVNRTRHSLLRRFSGIGELARNLTGLSQKQEPPVLGPEHIDYHPKGYPKLAAWMDSDENFLMCRRYGFLHTRVMLYRQDELRVLEQELLDLDDEDRTQDPRALISRERDDHRDGAERKKLINEIDKKLQEYDNIVLRVRSMASLPQVEPRNYDSFNNWVSNQGALCPTESQFIDRRQDFVALVDPKEGGWFDAFIEDFLLPIFPRSVTRLIFSDPHQRISTADPLTGLYSKPRIDRFARILVAVLAVALLMAPVVVLFQDEQSGTIKVVVILVFTFIFAAALSVFTKAKRHEVFASTAA